MPESNLKNLRKIGFIVNPIAGMGGVVGLKGTDGKEVLKKAISLGAKPIAPTRAEIFLSKLIPIKNDICLLVGSGLMGKSEAKKYDFCHRVFGNEKKDTKPEDTITIAKKIVEEGAEFLVFCGGDGTAQDILKAVDMKIPVLGVPTGVKMHSAVFAVDPKAAARIALRVLNKELPLWEAEVMDIDEEAFRKGRVTAKLFGYLLSPFEPLLIQGSKMASHITENELRNQAALAIYIIEIMKKDVYYIISAGTTTRTIGDLLDEKKTLLGVDIFYNKKIIAKDVNEKQILETIKENPTKIIVTPIGGQGFIFGRGNQQISSKVIRKVGKKNIIVIATENKMKNLKRFRIDTNDPKLDSEFSGKIKVITDYKTTKIVPIE